MHAKTKTGNMPALQFFVLCFRFFAVFNVNAMFNKINAIGPCFENPVPSNTFSFFH